jgi:hypothetical protein
MAQFYKCAWCDEFSGVMGREEVEEHLEGCEGYRGTVFVPRAKKKTEREKEVEEEEKRVRERKEEEEKKREQGGRNWVCPGCGEVLRMGTPVEILKHRRLCVGREV